MIEVSRVLELLLKGTHICQWAHPKAHKTITDEQQKIKMALSFHDLRLYQTERSGTYYVVYKNINSATGASIRKQQTEIHTALRPIVALIALISETTHSDSVITAGSEFSATRFSDHVTNSASATEKLNTICKHPSVKRKKNLSTISDKSRLVIDFMVRHGLIVLAHTEREIYQVTGRIDYIYATLNFLDERIDIVSQADSEQQQQGLF
ncbi:hypothetical protein A6E01_19895 (plasmid) [Vibrio breoganii]|uniref:Uncharacterized protein n=1 Tax=Vibrio breoganii TaxID=553239 RepID=A0AAN1CU95_9VIBR|nr:hypothetical protein [Vibrio breoganii]ANO35478.1 hypothetical protein A6E01_19895 [Vibrio breoganii]PML13918.1 hypothetical protein BCT84_12220 [Vibrio breoganii]